MEEPEEEEETEGTLGGKPQSRWRQVSQVGIGRQCQAKKLPALPGWQPADWRQEAVLSPPGIEVICKSLHQVLIDLYNGFFA